MRDISIRPAGYQPRSERFAKETLSDGVAPHVNAWRNNLTGLSHEYNLYFVAYEDVIYIWRPMFPTQHIPAESCHVLELPKTAENLSGHMPQCKPHSVNNLLIGRLGDKEILLCACDDGDVLAYWTSKIQQHCSTATHRNWEFLHGKCTISVAPFMHANVGMSAWGLAIQTSSRLVAVSCNSHTVWVYAFALTNTTPIKEEDENVASYRQSRVHLYNSAWRKHIKEQERFGFALLDPICDTLLDERHQNSVFCLEGHDTNIPAVTFCSTNSAEGTVTLASSDIAGVTIIWDVNTARQLRRLDPYRPEGSLLLGGWGLLSIDPRSFKKQKSIKESLGMCEAIRTSKDGRLYADISKSKYLLRHSGSWKTRGTIDDLPVSESAASTLTEDDDNSHNPGLETDGSDEIYESSAIPSLFMQISQTSVEHVLRMNASGIVPEHTVSNRSGVGLMKGILLPLVGLVGSCVNPEDTRTKAVQNSEWHPLMILHQMSIQLFQCPKWNSFIPRAEEPVIFFGNPFQQDVDDEPIARALHHYDRMNLYAQIPELGIVLVGTQKGRVAVLTLHQLTSSTFYKSDARIEPVYTMRLAEMLPLNSQENAGRRPILPLVGLATSPVQGTFKDMDRSKWRIMMMYGDHTVLSYEISREKDDTDLVLH